MSDSMFNPADPQVGCEQCKQVFRMHKMRAKWLCPDCSLDWYLVNEKRLDLMAEVRDLKNAAVSKQKEVLRLVAENRELRLQLAQYEEPVVLGKSTHAGFNVVLGPDAGSQVAEVQ